MNSQQGQSFDSSRSATASSPAPARVQAWRAAIRALISGYVDAYTLLSFGVYASFMTGNTTSGGVHAGELDLAAAVHSLLPIPFFLLGILIGTLLVQHAERPALHRLSALVSAMLVFDAAASHFGIPQSISIMILSIAMGMLNTSITQVGGQPVSVGFMTGDLNNFARQIAMRIQGRLETASRVIPGAQGRIGVLAVIWIAFVSGAILGAMLMPHLTVWALVLPAVALFVFAVLESPRFQTAELAP